MLDGVRDRTLDAALLPDAAVPRSELFVSELLGPIRFDVVFPAGHALSRRRKVDVADLSHEDLIAYDRKAYTDYWLLLRAIFTAAKRPLIVSAEVDGGGTLMASVASGQGVAIVAHTMRDSAGPGLEFRPLGRNTPAFRLALVVHRDLPQRTAGWLRHACREIFIPS
jgi:DNA-binding transcriptional LysR family regulator